MSILPGTRIVFPRDIIEPANGDHPEFLMAEGGGTGKVVSYDKSSVYPYSVTWDGWPHSFGADESDFITQAAKEQSDDN